MPNTSSKATEPTIIAVSGGIGSGKSTVCRALTAMGHSVYDCDLEARRLMDSDPAIKEAIASHISPACITPSGEIDRPALAAIVFSDPDMLETLNRMVHSAVKAHLAAWISHAGTPVTFVETAILYQSGLDAMVDEVWEVTAPASVRLARVMRRNSLDEASVLSRINAQDSFVPAATHPHVHTIVNDGTVPVLPQIETLLKSF